MEPSAGTFTTLQAIEELSRRGTRLTKTLALPLIFAGVAAGFVAYAFVHEAALARFGVDYPLGSGFVAFAPPVAIAVLIARIVVRRAVRARRPLWIRELAQRHCLDKAELEEYFVEWS